MNCYFAKTFLIISNIAPLKSDRATIKPVAPITVDDTAY